MVSSLIILAGCGSDDDSNELTAVTTTTTLPPPSQVVRSSQAGCYVNGLNSNTGFGEVGMTFNDAYYDQKFGEEINLQRSFFSNIPANVYVLYEPSIQDKNAYASSNGDIYFGYHMFYYSIANYGELAVAGILAHEWGHRVQQVRFGKMENPLAELEADAFSGFYMALGKSWAWSSIQGYYANVYATGDYNFHSPNHHGTSEQRLSAAYLGVAVAQDVAQNQMQLTYEDLHSIFLTEINSNILGLQVRTKSKSTLPIDIKNDVRLEIKSIVKGESLGKNIELPESYSPDNSSHLWPQFSFNQ